MCSNAGERAHSRAEAAVAQQLAAAIDELAAATAGLDTASADVTERLVQAWAMITAADPELAARAARYKPA